MFVGLLCDTKTGCGQYDLPSLALVQRTWRLLFFDWDPVESSTAKFYSGPSISFWDQLAIVRIKRAYENFGSVAP